MYSAPQEPIPIDREQPVFSAHARPGDAFDNQSASRRTFYGFNTDVDRLDALQSTLQKLTFEDKRCMTWYGQSDERRFTF